MNREITISPKGEATILDILRENNIFPQAPCNGRHTCGKCKVRLLYGNIEAGELENKHLTQKEIDSGIILACAHIPSEMIRVEILDDKNLTPILTETNTNLPLFSDYYSDKNNVFAAFDLGTTTIAAKLIKNGNIIHTASKINSQTAYGADVISRSEASINGKSEELCNCLIDDIDSMLEEFPITPTNLIFCGNTTIIHLLNNFPCDGLVKYPFTPYKTGYIKQSFMCNSGAVLPCTILPNLSAYIGGDIISGLFSLDFHLNNEINLFIDLGTNGEMALGNKSRILTASAAAGPAFEGTALNVATDVIKCISTLLTEGIIDENGLLKDPYFDEGYPYKTGTGSDDYVIIREDDIRNIQMAKSAIASGIALLIRHYGISFSDISNVFLAGGMGYSLDSNSAANIGLIPWELKNKIKPVGNSALAGCIKYASTGYNDSAINKLLSVSDELILGNEPEFRDLYFENMLFS